MSPSFPTLEDPNTLASPTLIVCPARIAANIERMIRIAGDPKRLRPHVKTHKMSEVVAMQMERGIEKFKCATLAELRMLIDAEAKDILVAMQPVGPALNGLVRLAADRPDCRIATLVDNEGTLRALEAAAGRKTMNRLGAYLDINNGMNRTGIAPGEAALQLYKSLCESSLIAARGLHIYDGHIRDNNPDERLARSRRDFESVDSLVRDIESLDLAIPNFVIGGSPSFPIHVSRSVDLSPGTTLLWDFGYGEAFSDLPFEYAAALFTRVISKPAPGLLCFDLGHKAVAAEMPTPRVRIIGLDDATFVSHSEEHLVVDTARADSIEVGDSFFAIPRHICPTVALHNKAATLRKGRIDGYWSIAARDRILD